MVKGKLLYRMTNSTVLAGIFVSLVDVGTGKTHLASRPPYLDELEKTENGGKTEGDRNAPHFPVVHIDDFYLSLREKRDCSLPGNDLERFKCRIEQKCLFHAPVPFAAPPSAIDRSPRRTPG
jgi:hypothetical protein